MIVREAFRAVLAGFLFALACACAQAQYRPPASISVTPSTSPETLQVLDSAGNWAPFGVFNPGTPVGVATDAAVLIPIKCDGVTDNAATIQWAVGFYPAARLPVGQCRTASPVTVPDNHALVGTSFRPNTGGTQGSVLLCDAAIAGPCVIAGQANSLGVQVRNLTVARGAGTIPSNGECILFNGDVASYAEHVECYNHAQGFETDWAGPNGAIFNYFDDIHTCRISDAHFIVKGVPQVYVGQHSTFGCDTTNTNPGDVTSNAFVRITGDWSQSVGTVHFLETQFNQGSGGSGVNQPGSTNCWLDFRNIPNGRVMDIEVIGGHVETAYNGICSDSTVTEIDYLQLIGVFFQGGWATAPNNQFINLNPATKPLFWALSADTWSTWAFNFASAQGYDDVRITGSSFPLTPVSITGGTHSNLTLAGNAWYGLTLAGNFDSGVSVSGTNRGGTYDYHAATGIVATDIADASVSACPSPLVLKFGGSSAGIAYSVNNCRVQLTGSRVTLGFNLELTSKGTATGVAQIDNLPYYSNADFEATSVPTLVNMVNACSATACGALVATSPSDNLLNLYLLGGGGDAQMTDANFTNTSIIQGSITYLMGN